MDNEFKKYRFPLKTVGINGYADYETLEGYMQESPEVIPYHLDVEATWADSVSKMAGTGYTTDIYRIVGTDDAVVIHRNEGGVHCPFYDLVTFKPGFFTERRVHWEKCKKMAEQFSVPVELVLAVYPVEEVVEAFAEMTPAFDKELDHELRRCGIARRKEAIAKIIGEGLADVIDLSRMGQKNSTRIALFLADRMKKF